MTETERARVGQALDLVRDALASYVDAAMGAVYGPKWDERVSDEDAKRRENGRKQLVSKSDLYVMLKVIQHERIAPWSNSKTYPRIRSFASEVFSVRNLYSHGNDCIDEYVRLLDTASRLLQLLDLPVPGGLEVSGRATTQDPGDEIAIAAPEQPPMDPVIGELERLGESVARLVEMWLRVASLSADRVQQLFGAAESSVGETEADAVKFAIGAEAFDLLEETCRLEADGEHDSTVQKVLIRLVRCLILEPVLHLTVWSSIVHLARDANDELASESERRAAWDSLIHRSSLMEKWNGQSQIERWRELVQLANGLGEGSRFANWVIVMGNMGNMGSMGDPTIENDEELRLFRDSSARFRMLAAMDPGTDYETYVVMYLRREGWLCNDLGRADEATRAFARADEIIDRYPAADPDLVFPGLWV